jgi:hypothetical protein
MVKYPPFALEIEGPVAVCGECRFATALKGKWSVEDGRLTWRGDAEPQPARGPDWTSCCESDHNGKGVIRFTRIVIGDTELTTKERDALRKTAGEAWLLDAEDSAIA